jgi:hypothetical protein
MQIRRISTSISRRIAEQGRRIHDCYCLLSSSHGGTFETNLLTDLAKTKQPTWSEFQTFPGS